MTEENDDKQQSADSAKSPETEPERAGNEEFVALGIGCLVTIIFLGSVAYFGMMRQ